MQRTHEDGGARHDRRGRPRVTVAVPFRLCDRNGRVLLSARTLDLSTGGALLHGTCSADTGSQVQVEISRGPARNPLTLAAQIVRRHAPNPAGPTGPTGPGNHGVAVRFSDVSPIDETVLAGIIRDARG